jgi:hypothetical protein
MANIDDLPSRRLRNPLSLLQLALAPEVEVVPAAVENEAMPDDADIRLELRHRSPSAGPPLRVRLASVGDPAPPHSGTDHTIWILDRPTREVRERLKANGASYLDIGRGAVHLALPGLLVDRTGVRIPRHGPPSRSLRDPFGDRASLVPRLLVAHPERRWNVRAIAAEVGISTMTASHVVRQLDEMGVLDVRQRGRARDVRLRDVARLVEHWTVRYNWRRNGALTVQAPIGDPRRFLRRLSAVFGERRWALTLHAGASLIAPHASWDRVHVYVDVLDDRALTVVAEEAGWTPGEGKVVLLRPLYDDSIWTETQLRERLPVVSTLQLVLDLWHYPVRGREQAEELLAGLARSIEQAGSIEDTGA